MSLFKHQSPATRKQSSANMWQNEINNLLDRFGRNFESGDSENLVFTPRIEVREEDKQYKIFAEVPGMEENDLNVTLKDNNLIIEGEKKSGSQKDDEGFYCSEICYGSYYRSIPLSEDVNPETVKASYKDGILRVELDKVKPSSPKSKKIPIMKS